jgi:DNA-binding response OmpR family regulator
MSTATLAGATRLVLVEDDADIATALQRALEREGYEVVSCADGASGLAAALHPATDVVLLDINLPDIDGLHICEDLRQQSPTLPVIFLTARAEEIDLVVGLDAGADDYITKPFKLAELNARIRARLRPNHHHSDKAVRIDRAAHRAWHGPTELDVSVKEFELLALLVEEAGRVVPRKEILARVWTDNVGGSGRTLDMHISTLRRKLDDDPNQPTMITTVRSVGFRFERGGG